MMANAIQSVTGGSKKNEKGAGGKLPSVVTATDIISGASPKPSPDLKPSKIDKNGDGKKDKTEKNTSSKKKEKKKEPDVCVSQKNETKNLISTDYSYKFRLRDIGFDLRIIKIKLERFIESKYNLSKGEVKALENIGQSIGNNLNVDTSTDFGDISSLLKNLGFKFSVGSWGQLNFILYTSNKVTSMTLNFFMQTINMFANDGVKLTASTKINDNIRMGLAFEASINKFLAVALVVAVTYAVPVIMSSVNAEVYAAAAWLKLHGATVATGLSFVFGNRPAYG